MTHILSLIGNPAAPALEPDVVAAVRSAVEARAEAVWLARGIAAEVPLDFADPAEIPAAELLTREALGGLPIDVAILPKAGREKKLLVADMDSTIIGQECVDELAEYAGRRAEISAVTERAMLGEMPFDEALRERVAQLKGVPVSAIGEIIAGRITITPGARELVNTMRTKGAHTALVSGGFTGFTGPIARSVGFDEEFANTLELDGELLSGRIVEPVRGREAKLEALKDLAERLGISLDQTMAVGDGANDLGMIEAAGFGIAYHAKPAVAAAADIRIDHGDLTALLYLQGYRAEEFGS